jgi:sugar/nucleoside kinase (ribokinase family)
MYDIITIGGATRDITFVTDKGKVIETPENLTEQSLLAFEYGAKIKSEEVFFNFGGGACNTATTFSKLGLNVAVNCRIGKDDDGKSMIKNLKELEINTDLIQINEDEKTGFSLVVVNKNGGDRVIFVYKGASDSLEIKKGNISNTKWIYLTSLAGNWKEDLEEINKAVEENKTKLAWNPGATQIATGKKGLKELLKNTELLIVNKDEAIELIQSDESVKLDYNEINDAVVLLKIIKSWGPKTVVITDGMNGAYLFGGDKNVLYSTATSKDRIDTTGAGDSFGSALVGGYILTGDLETALKYGIINSGNVVNEYGAQNGILRKDGIEKKLGDVKISYL